MNRAEKLTMQPCRGIYHGETRVEGIMDQFYHDYTRGTVSFGEVALLCKLTTYELWGLIKSFVVLNYPKLNEFWKSIAPMCFNDDAVPPERILNARFPLQEVLEFAVAVGEDDTENVEDVIISILTKYKKLYPGTNYSGDITVNTNAVASSSVDIMNSNNVNINGVTAEQMEEIIRAITQNAQRGAAPPPAAPAGPQAPEPGAAEAESAQGEMRERQIRNWKEASGRLEGKQREAAQLCIAKWEGKTNKEAYYTVFHNEVVNATAAASKRLCRVSKIINMFPDLKLLRPPNKNQE
ncbi:MAG: hypothetical protein LBR82_00490 [Desulfovibrio sp.]|jgi:hypothetical protein|nr:hypothetical protein [Desulfovibrio sp.]